MFWEFHKLWEFFPFSNFCFSLIPGVIARIFVKTMQGRKERKKIPIKNVYTHVMRAKLFGVLTVNALEGIVHEIDEVLPIDTMEGN